MFQTYYDSIVIDGLDTSNWDDPSVYDNLVKGGVTAINATISIWDDFETTMDNIAGWNQRFETFSNKIIKIRSVEDIYLAKKQKKCGVIFGWQNSSAIGANLERLSVFNDLGVKIIQITYNERNLVGNGCYENTDEGLINFGREFVSEMNKLGILIDLSHVGKKTSFDTIELSSQPVSITHSNSLNMDKHPRNKPDEMIIELAKRGGVIGSNAFPMFLPDGYASTIENYLDRIDYLVDLVGPDHVAIGTDFCQSQTKTWFEWLFSSQGTIKSNKKIDVPQPYTHLMGLENSSKFMNIATGLENRGYDWEDIKKIIGGNWLGLFKKVW